MLTERDFIQRVRREAAVSEPGLLRAIGDDCAAFLPEPGHAQVVTTDALVELVHFDRRWHPPYLLGRKTAAVNLSDIAAMGAKPRYALLSLALESDMQEAWLEQFMRGFIAALSEQQTVLIGGDTVRSDRLTFSVTVIGSVAPDRVLYRSGGRPGDLLWVSGPLGEAAAGLELCRRAEASAARWPQLVQAHLDPQPRTALGRFLAARGLVRAMMDLSDGLATDLAHLCTESGCGAEIDADLLPISSALAEAADHLGRPAVEYALTGGEDYELLFATLPEVRDSLPREVKTATGLEIRCLGRLRAQPGVELRQGGALREIGYGGYDHFR